MIEIYQGETVTFALSGDNSELQGFKARAALRPSTTVHYRDAHRVAYSAQTWNNIDIVDGIAVWSLTSEESERLPVGIYAIEIALTDISTQQEVKEKTIEILKVKQSYTL